jgi:hypothetical protein
MSRFEIAINLIVGGICLLVTSGNPITYVIGIGAVHLVVSIIEMVNHRGY